jgi:hypothetical protein
VHVVGTIIVEFYCFSRQKRRINPLKAKRQTEQKRGVTDDPWLETRSEICSPSRQINLHLDELLTNLLENRKKRMLICVRYNGAKGSSDLKVVDAS